jgi:hypothetical protein
MKINPISSLGYMWKKQYGRQLVDLFVCWISLFFYKYFDLLLLAYLIQ